MGRFASVLLVGLVFSAWLARGAEAACNSIPAVEKLSLPSTPPVTPLKAGLDPAVLSFGFKGALGRIDRPYLSLTGKSEITVVSDEICVRPDGRAVRAPARLTPIDDLVAFVHLRDGDAKHSTVRVYAALSDCAGLAKLAQAGAGKKGGQLEVLPTCSLDGVKAVTIGSTGAGLRIPLPDAPKAAVVQSVRVVVAPKQRVAALLEAGLDRPCSQVCGESAESAAICIDDILVASVDARNEITYSRDDVPCGLQGIPSFMNDFSAACEAEPNTPPSCPGGALPPLKAWQDSCGGVHFPFDWSGIRQEVNGMKPPREVRGRTGVGKSKSDENPAVWVPGREFVGSTADAEGTSSDPLKPLIEVWDESEEEYGLQGTIDQDVSFVHVFPRLRTQLVCAGTTGACMGVQQTATGGEVFCACRDAHLPGCTCDELPEARYFMCGNGPRRGMPCTRDRHCQPGGRCNAKPRCQKEGEVWTGLHGITGVECTVPADCSSPKPQCGYRLFNLQEAIEPEPGNPHPTTGIVVLDSKVVGGGRKRRGVCKVSGKPCGNGNGNGPGACGANDECRGYQLRAGKLAP